MNGILLATIIILVFYVGLLFRIRDLVTLQHGTPTTKEKRISTKFLSKNVTTSFKIGRQKSGKLIT